MDVPAPAAEPRPDRVDVEPDAPAAEEPRSRRAGRRGTAKQRTTATGPYEPRFELSPRPIRWLTMWGALLACICTGWQTSRAVDGREWSSALAAGALVGAVTTAAGILIWTWIVVENGRRLLAPARTEHPPSPSGAVLAWMAPMVLAVGSAAAMVFLQERLHESTGDDSSPVPLAVAGLALTITLMLAYRPLYILSSVTRRLGGGSVELSRMFWAPIALFLVGSASLVVMRVGGVYEEDFDGLAPAWALGAVAIPPTVIVLVLAWRGAISAEAAIDGAFARRDGIAPVRTSGGGLFARALRADPRAPIQRDLAKRIRLVPGLDLTRLAVVTVLSALALLSIVGALVMFLFWQESRDGELLQSQETRAWDALGQLGELERVFALALLVIATIWTFVNVLNARLASGRRRNPFVAAAAWPAAAYGIWAIADRVGDDERILAVLGGFALQAVVLFVPFFLLERAAASVGALRHPLRVSYGLGVILLVQTQGLAGLSTIDTATPSDQFGRLAGYLALTALVELLCTLTITESSRLIGDAARHEAERHNLLVQQREDLEDRLAAKSKPPAGPAGDAGAPPVAGTEPTATPALDGSSFAAAPADRAPVSGA